MWGRLPHPFIITLRDAEHRPRSRPAVLGRPAQAGRAADRADDRQLVVSLGAVLRVPRRRHRLLVAGGARHAPGVGTVDLRDRWQPRGRSPHRHPGGSVLISVYVLCGLLAGVAGDHHLGPPQRRLADGGQPRRARLDRRSHHRWRQLPRRPRHRAQRAGRRADDRRDPQRDEPVERRRVPAADRHRRRHRARGRVRRGAGSARGAIPGDAGGARHDDARSRVRAARRSASVRCSRSSQSTSRCITARCVAILGDNGAGKSTLIKCISGVHRLDAGDDRDRRQARDDHLSRGSPALRHRDRVSRPGAVRQPRPGRELLRGPRRRRAELAAAHRCASCVAGRWPRRDHRGARASAGHAARPERRTSG